MNSGSKAQAAAKSATCFIVVALVVLAAGCGGGSGSAGFHVVDIFLEPTPAETDVPGADYNIKVSLTIEFSDEVDLASLVAPGNVNLDLKGIRDGRTALSIPGTFRALPDLKTAFFISDENFDEVMRPRAGETIEYTIEIVGSGSSPVTSAAGEALDGDEDGSAGGDYTETFEVFG